jgi:hypothetical protein
MGGSSLWVIIVRAKFTEVNSEVHAKPMHHGVQEAVAPLASPAAAGRRHTRVLSS